ncbi:hypothetical protein ACU686_03775 [Yinghuangia aomiensis]
MSISARKQRREARIAAEFDGRAFVTITLWHASRHRSHRATEIAHELGYRLAKVAFTSATTSLDFRRDDTPEARDRAAAATAVVQATGHLPSIPAGLDGLTSRHAAKARFDVAAHRSPETRQLRFGVLFVAALMLLLTGSLALHRSPNAAGPLLILGALFLMSAGAIVADPWRSRRHKANLELIHRYDSARHHAAEAPNRQERGQ